MTTKTVQVGLTVGLAVGALCIGGWRFWHRQDALERDFHGAETSIARQLSLTASQEEAVRTILETKRPEIQRAIKDVLPRMEAQRNGFHEALSALLTEEQREKFNEFWEDVGTHKRKRHMPMLRVLLESCPAAKTDAPAPVTAASPSHEAESDHDERHKRMIADLTARFGLTPQQQAAAEELLDKSDDQILPLRKEMRRRVSPVTADLEPRITAVLTPLQRERWHELREKYIDAEDCPQSPVASAVTTAVKEP